MNTNHKINALLISCIIIVSTLSLIQYYLVKNTYQLTKEKYYREVRTELIKITNSLEAAAIEEKVLENLKQTARLYTDKKLSKAAFFTAVTEKNDSVIKAANSYFNRIIISNPMLKGVLYQSQYDEIVLDVNGREDTLLAVSARPYVYTGHIIHSSNTLLLSQGNTQSFTNKNIKKTGKNNYSSNFRIRIKGSHYIDISLWKQEVFKRMSSIFLLAAGLIIAVIVFFYLVFNAMLKQKKIAEVKTDFANNITHELKTPLSSVNLILKTLERKEVQANPMMFDSLLQSLYRQQAKIQQIVDSVMESAMLTDVRMEQAELDITNYLLQYAKDLMLASHLLVVQIEPVRQIIKIHLPTLEKVLNNLIYNAVKYSPEGSQVTFKTYLSEGCYTIEVTDQGPGIAHTYQTQVFDKFYRIPEQNTHTVKGLGLGLYISKQAINQLGGSLTLASTLGKGCTFTIKLPMYES
jgi:two-component system phosphate regulon sensor histidine kinase PhoR